MTSAKPVVIVTDSSGLMWYRSWSPALSVTRAGQEERGRDQARRLAWT